jgi:hypothetical protein
MRRDGEKAVEGVGELRVSGSFGCAALRMTGFIGGVEMGGSGRLQPQAIPHPAWRWRPPVEDGAPGPEGRVLRGRRELRRWFGMGMECS